MRSRLLAVLVAGALAAACNGDDDTADVPTDDAVTTTGVTTTGVSDPVTTTASADDEDGDVSDDELEELPTQSEECELFTDDEIAEHIGAHDGGQQDYLFGGCVWSSTEFTTEGFIPAIHVAVLTEEMYDLVAEIGDPVDELGAGATYAPLYGELWFPCGDGRFCGVKAAIATSDEREVIAMEVGRAMQQRV
jgi:hypothetical protein